MPRVPDVDVLRVCVIVCVGREIGFFSIPDVDVFRRPKHPGELGWLEATIIVDIQQTQRLVQRELSQAERWGGGEREKERDSERA